MNEYHVIVEYKSIDNKKREDEEKREIDSYYS